MNMYIYACKYTYIGICMPVCVCSSYMRDKSLEGQLGFYCTSMLKKFLLLVELWVTFIFSYLLLCIVYQKYVLFKYYVFQMIRVALQ